MNLDELKQIYIGKSEKINSYRLRDKFLEENPDIEIFVNSTIDRKDLTLHEKISMLIFNGGDFCRVCNTNRLNGIGHRNKYTCEVCVKEISLQKRKTTSIEIYGTEIPSKSKQVKKKAENTNIKRYGVKSTASIEEVKEKCKKTNIDRYGVGNPMQNKDISRKSRDTTSKKYGEFSHVCSNDNFKHIQKMDDVLFEIYTNPQRVYEIYTNEMDGKLFKLADHFKVTRETMARYFRKYNLPINRNKSISFAENEMTKFIETNGIDVIKNSRSVIPPYELDIYVPSHNIAIEYCGAYWHSELFKEDKNYHYNKWKMCKDHGIQLLTFWDIEYKNNPARILSYIKSKIGLFETRLFARNVEFIELKEKQYDFFEYNHLQGRPSSIDRNFGLIFDDALVGCISYSKHHRNSSDYTLNRLAFKSGIQVIGGAGKLIKKSLELINTNVITWSDNRYSNGKLYENNGFEFQENLKPDYCYYDNVSNRLMSKQSNMKSKIGCPPNMTEREFCTSIGRYRLWDCGKMRFIHTQ